MKKKIIFLSISCVLTVLALAMVQGYFIYNTYLLKAKEANDAITKEFLRLETQGELDALNQDWMQKTGEFIYAYKNQGATLADYRELIKKNSDSLSRIMSNHISSDEIFDSYQVSYTNYIATVTIFEAEKPDTIFRGKMGVFSSNYDKEPETQASQSTWRGNTREYVKYPEKPNFDFEIVTKRFYSIANWKEKVFYKMSGLLVFSVALLVFVVLLFYWSIKNLITQKKIADIRTDFINNITHEFQTPLSAMALAVKTLEKKDSLSVQQFQATLEIIARQNLRMQKLFAQVAQASVRESSPENRENLNDDSISQIVSDFSLLHPDVKFIYDARPVRVIIDRTQLNSVMVNLMDNAVKYGASTIEISAAMQRENFVLVVKDNGIGITQKEQIAIFQKFYRIQKGDIHTTKGLGLGLYYVQEIARAYNGTIQVESDGQSGSMFTFSIPQP